MHAPAIRCSIEKTLDSMFSHLGVDLFLNILVETIPNEQPIIADNSVAK